jgi:nuclear pore complex protein Nup205
LKIFFELILAILKIVASVLMARGVENEQMKTQVRDFLSENRSSVVAVFKRNAKIGWRKGAAKEEEDDGMSDVLSECVDLYSLLISATGWLDVSYLSRPTGDRTLTIIQHEDLSSSQTQRSRLTVFS